MPTPKAHAMLGTARAMPRDQECDKIFLVGLEAPQQGAEFEPGEHQEHAQDRIGDRGQEGEAQLPHHQGHHDEKDADQDRGAARPGTEAVVGRKPPGAVAHGHRPEKARGKIDEAHGEGESACAGPCEERVFRKEGGAGVRRPHAGVPDGEGDLGQDQHDEGCPEIPGGGADEMHSRGADGERPVPEPAQGKARDDTHGQGGQGGRDPRLSSSNKMRAKTATR